MRNFALVHRLEHARQPLITFDDANGEGQVACAQAWMSEAFDEIAGAAHPSAQEPKQLVARAGHVLWMERADRRVFRFRLHEIIKAIDQFADGDFAAKGFIKGCRHGLLRVLSVLALG